MRAWPTSFPLSQIDLTSSYIKIARDHREGKKIQEEHNFRFSVRRARRNRSPRKSGCHDEVDSFGDADKAEGSLNW